MKLIVLDVLVNLGFDRAEFGLQFLHRVSTPVVLRPPYDSAQAVSRA